MKGLGKILIIIFALLSVISLLWVVFTNGAFDPKIIWDPNTPVVSFIIIVMLIALLITTVLFLYYKVLDLIKHPSHMREALFVVIPILIAVVLGFILSSSDPIIYGTGKVYENGKFIGLGIVSTLVLLVGAIGLIVWDIIRGLIKN